MLPASSAARALYEAAPAHVRAAPAVAMGARTEEAARELGIAMIHRARTDPPDDLVDAALRVLAPGFTVPAIRPGAAPAPRHPLPLPLAREPFPESLP